MAIVTVDVWDTLIRRRCHPDAVKQASARYILGLFGHRIADAYQDPGAIVLLRQNIELEIGLAEQKKGYDDEYDFSDVLAQLICRLVGDEPVNREHISSVVDFEFDFECSVTYADPHIVAEIEKLNPVRCFFLSDFYMQSSFLKRLLKHHGLDICEDGFSSCDIKLNKRSGRLYDWFIEQHSEDIAKYGYYHIGDNYWSDVEMAQQKGIKAIHYIPEMEHQLRQHRESSYSNPERLLAEINAQLESLASGSNEIQRLGTSHSLLYWGFANHIRHDALAKNLDRVYFFTREGEFFKTIYDEVNSHLADSQKGPKSELLEVSRISTFFPSLRQFSTDELMRLWNLYSTQSMASLFKTLALPLHHFEPFFTRHNIDPNSEIVYPWKDSRVIALFDDSKFQTTLSSIKQSRLYALDGYLNEKGFYDGANVGIVDIGWRGTIQDNLSYVRPSASIEGYYLGLQAVLNNQPENANKQAYGPDLNKSFIDEDLLNAVAPLEMLCNSPNGSVLGYEKEMDSFTVKKKIDQNENGTFEKFTVHYQRGVELGVLKLSQIETESRMPLEAIREEALRVWRSIIKTPHPKIAEAYFSLNHNEDFGVGSVIDKSETLRYSDLILAPIVRKRRKRVFLYIKNIQWMEGYFHRSDISIAKRRMLMLLMQGALIYKKILVRWRVRQNAQH